jgi:hypothetical protein
VHEWDGVGETEYPVCTCRTYIHRCIGVEYIGATGMDVPNCLLLTRLEWAVIREWYPKVQSPSLLRIGSRVSRVSHAEAP